MSEANSADAATVPARVSSWLWRLRRRARLLLSSLLIVLSLVMLAGLPVLAAVGAGAALIGVFALMPEGARVRRDLDHVPDAAQHLTGLMAFADALVEPVVLIDRRRLVVHRNRSAETQFTSLTVGLPVTLSLRNPELVRAVEQAVKTGEVQSFELHETVPSETWTRVIIAPLRVEGRNWALDDGRLLAITFQSLTELKRVDAMRADFVANASHELRTPLTSLLGFIETLQGPAAHDAEARQRFLGIMQAQAQRMSRLIEDLLSLSRIEMHQHMRPTGRADLVSLVREVVDSVEPQARDNGVVLDVAIRTDDGVVTGDRNQLLEVVENLVDNAIKYGATGERVEVVLAPAPGPMPALLLAVTDFGPGVGEEHVPRLTERFYRSTLDLDRRTKGTGLGLAIVKHIVARHRGQLKIWSRPGQGMRVEVMLPR